MSILRLNGLLEFLTSIKLLMAMLWLGLAIFTIGLAILMYTRWGQYKPLRKCMVMSVLAHLLLAGYATTVEIMTPTVPPPQPTIQLTLGDGPDAKAAPGGAGPKLALAKDQPWEVFPSEEAVQPKETEPERAMSDRPAKLQRMVRTENERLPSDPAMDHLAVAKSTAPTSSVELHPVAIDAPTAQRRDAPRLAMSDDAELPRRPMDDVFSEPTRTRTDDVPAALLDGIVPPPKMSESSVAGSRDATLDSHASTRLKPVSIKVIGGDVMAVDVRPVAVSGPIVISGSTTVPDPYRLRVAPNREGVVQSHGGTGETEAAVKAALRWLADNQSADGRWDPRVHGAGKDDNVLGRNRQNAGSKADTAMTGLALLAFLGSGHTHLEGPYRDDVRRGLEFLMLTQLPDGNLGGQAAAFEFMYSHAMATCALSEAYGMTHDQRLRDSVRRAIGYTIAAQDLKGGGWRYKPGDAGDTSQLGWQLMSLKSAELAGISIPSNTRQGIIKYLQSVSSGKSGGLASYRPGEPATRSMTAEAMVCWQFLGLPREHPACNEAGDFVMGELPGEGTYNLYYWYYATLSMYQLQGNHWQRWNEALRHELVNRQIKTGVLAGSWDTNDLWGGYGGRVYTTAMATLMLEVYYRFLPIYRESAFVENSVQ
jgi:hypothetical protein